MRFMSIALLSVLSTAVLAVPADTDGSQKSSAERGACHQQIKAVCGNVQPGEGRLKQCLEANRDKISPNCQQQMARTHEQHGDKLKACNDDVKRLCPGIEAGGGRLHQCLKQNEASLTPDCRKVVKHNPAPRAGKAKE